MSYCRPKKQEIQRKNPRASRSDSAWRAILQLVRNDNPSERQICNCHEQFGAVAAGESFPPPTIAMMKSLGHEDGAEVSTEDLGTQTMEGLLVGGVTTRTIPAGEIGNEKPLAVVTEVWTSPDLKTIIYSKRNDPRMGEQVFKLTNIQRAESDPSLFTIPSDFRLTDGPQTFRYRTSP